MTPERYASIVDVFHAAAARSPNLRGRFLSEVCERDDDLRRAVEDMLAADEHSSHLLDDVPGDLAAEALFSSNEEPLIGRDIAEYHLIDRLGSGGMGDVFLAFDRRLNRRTALKLLPQAFASDPSRLRRFEREALAASALNHPNIVTVYGLGQVGTLHFLATEFIDGKNLREELSKGPLAAEAVVEIAIQAASALAAAHGAGIVHRDIKPENIMVRADGLVKIVDFGLAKRIQLDEFHALVGGLAFQTIPGLILGTPRYMSPEQARGLPVDARSDLFSLGSVLYEVLTATPAVGGANLGDILSSLLSRDPTPVEMAQPHCPAGLVHIVRRAIEKDRDQRYQTAEEMLADLETVRQQIKSGKARPITPSRNRRRRAPRWWIAGSAAAALVLAAASLKLVKHEPIGEVKGIAAVTTYPGNERQPSLSPDGREVAFSWEGENADNRDIYVTPIGEQQPRRLTTDSAEDAFPAWSPDGSQIAFIRRHANSEAEIVLISARGGWERHLRQIRLGAWITGRMLAWSPNGKWLVFTNEVGTSANHALFLLSLESGAVRQFSPKGDKGEGDSCPAFSPDGRWLAFARFATPASSSLLLQRLSRDLMPDGAPLTVRQAGVNPFAPVWTKDGKRVLFLEGSRIMQAEIGRAARSFYVSPFVFSELTLAGSGSRLRIVASQQNPNEEIWSLPLGSNGLVPAGSPERVVPSTRSETHPRFSPDGRRLAFRSGRSGSPELWLADANGSNPRQLTHMSAYAVSHPQWSPDGRFLAFDARFPAEPQLYVARPEDGVVRRITSRIPGFAVPSWSADGKALYACAFAKGETYIYRVSASDGVPVLLCKGAEADEVPGRKLLLYSKEDEWGIYARSLTGEPEKNPERLLAPDYEPPWGAFFAFEDGFYYVAYKSTGVPRAFRYYSFNTGKAVDIAPAPLNIAWGLTVPPDRTRLVFSTRSHEGEDLVQVQTE